MNGAHDASRTCDIVMKGGITSGIVYPPALLEIARAFRFRNIGGTSAGAIAACATAAAEYRRHNGGGLAGFERFARVPEELGTDHRLFRLFVPNLATKPIFDAAVAAFTEKNVGERATHVVRLATGPLCVGSLLGSALGIALGAASVGRTARTENVAGVAAGLALAVLGALVGATAQGALHTLRTLPKNFYGLCTGLSDAGTPGPPALDAWLGALVDEIADLPAGEPLTFGHLWYGSRRAPETFVPRHPGDAPPRPDEPIVDLQMMTTSVSHGRPYTFPISTEVFFFDPAEMAAYFPAYVVRWMVEHARLPSHGGTYAAYAPLLGLPHAADLPVLVAARMSLAFPLLLSAVKLYAIDYSLPEAGRKPEPCWFSDGGLSSNFPIQLFDSPLPRWPTFAINLGGFGAAHPYDPTDERKNVSMPDSNGAGQAEQWSRFASLPAFVSCMLGAVKDWNDNTQSRLPGYRDRIVTVMLRDEEGGLNLDMGEDVIAKLAQRGAAAGAMLVQRFATPSVGALTHAMNWENHRWVRYRSGMASMQRYLGQLANAFANPAPGDLGYGTFVEAVIEQSIDKKVYPLNAETALAESATIGELSGISAAWTRANIDFGDHAPSPRPDLTHRARL